MQTPRQRGISRAAAIAAASALVMAMGWVSPAWACGCGAMIADSAVVNGESAVVHFDGERETVLMQLDVISRDRDAALILPTPAPAKAELGDDAAFSALAAASLPRIEYRDDWWGGPWGHQYGADGAAPGRAGGGVDVLESRRLGPFDVATLAADDSAALADWLDEHGYELPGDLESALTPYVEDGWYYVAVRLAADDPEAELSGALDPIQVDFASEELVYPMRLTALADTGQQVRLYLLAEHRMRRTDPGADAVPSDLVYAGRIGADSFGDDDPMRARVGADGAFLTTFDHDIDEPSRVRADFAFARTAKDTPYQRVEWHTDHVQLMGMPAGYFLVGLGTLLTAAVAALVLVRAARRRGRNRPHSAPTA